LGKRRSHCEGGRTAEGLIRIKQGARGRSAIVADVVGLATWLVLSLSPPADALSLAAWQGDEAAVGRLLEAGAALNQPGERDWTPLHWAVIGGRTAVVKALLEHGADPNARGQYDLTPLHWAALQSQAGLVPLLVLRGADVGARNLYGMTPLHEAGDEKTAAALLEAGAGLEQKDDSGFTPLFPARTKAIGQALLGRGANVNARSADGRTLFDMLVVNTLLPKGLMLYGRRNGARLKGEQARFEIVVRNVSALAVEQIALKAESKLGPVTPPAPLARLNPGQRAAFQFVLARGGELPEGIYPLIATVWVGGAAVGTFELEADNHRGETPQDRGMVRLNQVTVKATSSSTLVYVPFLAVPLLVLGIWAFLRARRVSQTAKSESGTRVAGKDSQNRSPEKSDPAATAPAPSSGSARNTPS